MTQLQILQSSRFAKALEQMNRALAILDELGAPGEIGCHLDLAIARLEEQLNLEHRTAGPVERLVARRAPEPAVAGAGATQLPNPWPVHQD